MHYSLQASNLVNFLTFIRLVCGKWGLRIVFECTVTLGSSFPVVSKHYFLFLLRTKYSTWDIESRQGQINKPEYVYDILYFVNQSFGCPDKAKSRKHLATQCRKENLIWSALTLKLINLYVWILCIF